MYIYARWSHNKLKMPKPCKLVDEAAFFGSPGVSTMQQVLDQQEGEYETELQQLIAAAEAELHGERENTGKLRATLQVLHALTTNTNRVVRHRL